MKRYLYVASVTDAAGTQVFYVDAESREEADELIESGGEIYSDEVEVQNLSDYEFLQETELDDFGDYGPDQPKTPQHQWISCSERLPDEKVDVLVGKSSPTPEVAWGYLSKGEWHTTDGLDWETVPVEWPGYGDSKLVLWTHWMPLPAPPAEEVKP